VKTYDGLGNLTTRTFDAAGNIFTETLPLGGKTMRTYEDTGKLATSIDPNGGTFTFAYDANHLLKSQTDPLGRVTSYDLRQVVEENAADDTVDFHDRWKPDDIDMTHEETTNANTRQTEALRYKLDSR
jgi:YD repeat-containing protein